MVPHVNQTFSQASPVHNQLPKAVNFHKLVENVPAIIYRFQLSPDGSFSLPFVSSGCYEILGLSPEIMQADIVDLELIHPDDRLSVKQNIVASAETLQTFCQEYRIVLPSGEIKWLQAVSRPEAQPDGSIIWDGLMIDISDRKQIEEKLQLHSQLIGQVKGSIVATNLEGVITSWNKGAEALFGYTAQEAIGRHITFVYSPKQHQFLEQQVITPLLHKGSHKAEVKMIRKSQEEFDAILDLSLTKDSAGAVIGMLGYSIDISDRKRAEAKLQEQEQFLRSIYNGVEHPIIVVDLSEDSDFYYTSLNPAAERILGVPDTEIIGKTPKEVFGLQGTRLCQLLNIVLEKGTSIISEEQFLVQDRKTWWILTINPIKNSKNQISRLIVTTFDSTALKQAQQEQARLIAILEEATDLVGIADAEGHSLYLNKAGQKILGMSQEMSTQFHIHTVYAPTEVNRLQQEILPTAKTKGRWVGETVLKTCDGQEIPVSQVVVAHRADNGSVEFLSTIVRDISERKQAEMVLREQAKSLEKTLYELHCTQTQMIQSEKMSSLGQMVAGIAHEINNPINFIHGNLSYASKYTEELLQLLQLYQNCYPHPQTEIQAMIEEIDLDFLQEDLLKLINSMKVGTQRIHEIVQSLRTFSRLDEAECKIADIHEGINSTLMILNHRLKAKPAHPAILIVKNYGDIPLVECYPGQLNQVFMNILVNAIEALEERDQTRTLEQIHKNPSSILISTEMVESNEFVQIKIRDNGLGIPEKIQNRIFDPFFTTKAVGKGTGLGMSISYQIVTQRHKGALMCYSSPGEGTEFVIQIPIRQGTS